MRTWRNEHNCAACHHGPMYLWSINIAKRQGYEVDDVQLQEMSRWLLTSDESRIFPKPAARLQHVANSNSASDRMTAAMMGHRNLSQPTLYLTHALNSLPENDPLKRAGWQKVINHLAEVQSDDGAFEGRNAWRPIFNSPQILTLFAATGLRDAARSPELQMVAETHRDVLNKSEAFLSRQTADETHQGLVLRLLSAIQKTEASLESSKKNAVTPLVDRLLKLQRPDGGWAQTEDRMSDAFATGQTLYAMQRARVSVGDRAIVNGLEFLVRTQRQDGSWPMTSRPSPENGKPAEFLNPITYAATAWATLGLTSYFPMVRR
jgi:hypothetical protein